MTWGEFKKLVSEKVIDDARIFFIDVQYPTEANLLIEWDGVNPDMVKISDIG